MIGHVEEITFVIATLKLRRSEHEVELISVMQDERRDSKFVELCILYLQGVLLHELLDHKLFPDLGLFVSLQDAYSFCVVHNVEQALVLEEEVDFL